ncbi:CAP domain-containing protein [Streptomyces platensis]|uniref:CAP domain-containing protein n=1 Tax=Streptomyces platensis TaxID=58346 RepID=UPI002E82341C|nr:CAP domain-containing protein [Streptomyces platensis]WUB78265.1 CAP domain-containing protein [Streptomyces platensis]
MRRGSGVQRARAGRPHPRSAPTAVPRGRTRLRGHALGHPSGHPLAPGPDGSDRHPGRCRCPRWIAGRVQLPDKARVEHGCAPLHRDPRLDMAARLHSQDMAAHSHYSHTSTNGKGPKERMEAQGYDDASAENIDAWPTTPQGAFDAWMHSPGHRANILGCRSKATGIGVALGGEHRAYWT